ncbi:MAG: bifunctional oligoribonuclease/PAP phosphatase NrnA [Clostridiales bacterium]
MDNVVREIRKSKKIAIIPHISADGDALGSSFGIALALKKINKSVDVFLEEDIPQVYNFLPGKELEKEFKYESGFYDLVIAIDSGDVKRLGARSELFERGIKTINIDHHETNTFFGFHNWIEKKASSVGEMIYKLLKELNIELDKEISTCLYVAISADTGGFRFSNTTAYTHKIISELVSFGIDIADISRKIFDSISFSKLILMSRAINNTEIIEKGKVSIITLKDKETNIKGLRNEDYDGIINIGRNLHGVEVCILFRELLNKEIKINFRSNYYVDVAKIANMYKGGGHKRAAGCIQKGKLEEVKKWVLEDIIKEI